MRNSYIANTHEAAALNSGKQTAVVVKMKWQPPTYGIAIRDGYGIIEDPEGNVHARFKTPYRLGQEVYVKETLYQHGEFGVTYGDNNTDWVEDEKLDNSRLPYKGEFGHCTIPSIHMPECIARTRFKVVGVEAVRAQSILANSELLYPITCGAAGIECWRRLYKLVTAKFGQQAWDENHFIWYFKIEKL
jgi:hypothetical protein